MGFEETSQFGVGLQHRVSAELAVVFERAGLPGRTAPMGSPAIAVENRFARGPKQGVVVGILAVVALGAVGVGAVIVRSKPLPAVMAAPSAPPILPRTASLDNLSSAAAPTSVALPETSSAPDPATAQPPASARAPAVSPAHALPKAVGHPSKAKDRAARTQRYAAVKAPLCPTGGGCRAAVLDADRRLRAAYAVAARAGVSSSVLAHYRDRWAERREQDANRPASLVKSYELLTLELRQEADEARDDYRPAAHRSASRRKAADPWR